MSPLARYIVDAIVLEDQSPTDLAPQEQKSPTLGRRPRRTHRHRRWPAAPRPHPRPNSRLPTTRWTLACAQCLATGAHDVLRQDNGGPEGIRTPYLLRAIQALSLLSDAPTCPQSRGERPVQPGR